MIRLRCEIAVPSGLRQNRVLVKLQSRNPEVLELLPARPVAEATHQLVSAWGVPLLTHLNEADLNSAGLIQSIEQGVQAPPYGLTQLPPQAFGPKGCLAPLWLVECDSAIKGS